MTWLIEHEATVLLAGITLNALVLTATTAKMRRVWKDEPTEENMVYFAALRPRVTILVWLPLGIGLLFIAMGGEEDDAFAYTIVLVAYLGFAILRTFMAFYYVMNNKQSPDNDDLGIADSVLDGQTNRIGIKPEFLNY